MYVHSDVFLYVSKKRRSQASNSIKWHNFQNEIDQDGVSYPTLYNNMRRQTIISENIPFPCNVNFGRYVLRAHVDLHTKYFGKNLINCKYMEKIYKLTFLPLRLSQILINTK